MRTCASHHPLLAIALALSTLVPRAVVAQDNAAAVLFDDAQRVEITLRHEIGAFRAGAPSMPLIRRARILVGTYEDMARLFPERGQGDKALWQGTSLAADVFDVFKDSLDHAAAARLTELLESKYPSSPFLAQARRRIAALPPLSASGSTQAAAPVAQPAAARPVARVGAPPRAAPQPAAPDSAASMLRAIHREALPGVLRVSLEFDREVAFHEERLDGPPRVLVDLQNTRAAATVQDARLLFDDDVVRQIRVGREVDRRTRVVLDLSQAPAHNVYTRYAPFRIIIDFERPSAGATPAIQAARAPIAADPKPADTRVATAPVTTVPTRAVQPAEVPTVPPTRTAPVPAIDARSSASALPGQASPSTAAPVTTPKKVPLPSPPLPARTAAGLSVSRQLGLGVARIVIDPGHGGHDPGATEGNIVEAELVLDVALRLETLLQKSGIDVALTRRADVYVPLEERSAIAMREGADLFLSIHANASADRRAQGVETYILNFAPNAQSAAVAARENIGSTRTMRDVSDIVRAIALNNRGDESRDFATQVQASLVEKLSKGSRTVRNLGVKQAPFAVLVGAEIPSILAELGFITNKQDAAMVKTAANRQRIAEALALGISRYQKRLKPAQVAKQVE